MHRAELLLTAVVCLVAHASAQETPAQNLVRLWLDDPRPEIEARVVELGADAVAPLLAQLGIVAGKDEDAEKGRVAKGNGQPFLVSAFGPTEQQAAAVDAKQLERRRLALSALALLGAPARTAFAPLARAAAEADHEARIPYYEALAQLAAWRHADDRLWPEYHDHAARRLLERSTENAEWLVPLVRTMQRTSARCWGRPRTTTAEFATLLDSCSPWRIELALDVLAREAETQRESMHELLPRLLDLTRRPDPRILFTTRRVPLRAKAARIALAIAPGSADERTLRGVLLGEPPSIEPSPVPEAVAARVRERLAELGDPAKRPDTLAALAAFGPVAFPAIAAELDVDVDPEVGSELLHILAAAAPHATHVLPALLDAVAKVPTGLHEDLLQTVIAIAPWSCDRIQWCHVGARSVYCVEEQILPVPYSLESTAALQLLGLASEADGHCTFDELRDLLTSKDHLLRQLGVHLAIVRPSDLPLLQKELAACLEAERDPKLGNPFTVRSDAEAFEAHRLAVAKLLLPALPPGSRVAALAQEIVDEAKPPEAAAKEPTQPDRATQDATPSVAAAEAPSAEATSAEATSAEAKRRQELRAHVAGLDGDERAAATQALQRAGTEAVEALVDGLGEDEPVARTIARLAVLEQMPKVAAGRFLAIQRAACKPAVPCPVEYLRVLAELAPYRNKNVPLDTNLPTRVSWRDHGGDPATINQALAKIARRLRARDSVAARNGLPDLLQNLRSRNPYVLEAAIEVVTDKGPAASDALPLLRAIARRDDSRVLRTGETVPLREKALAALRAIDASAAAAEAARPPERSAAAALPDRIRVRVLELLEDLAVPERRGVASETLLQMAPYISAGVTEFAVSDRPLAARLEALDVLVAATHDTTAVTAALVDALANAEPEARVPLLLLLSWAAPWSHDVVPPIHGNGSPDLALHDIDLARGTDARGRMRLRHLADAVDLAAAFDVEAPDREIESARSGRSFVEELHAMLAIQQRPGRFETQVESLLSKLTSTGVSVYLAVWLDERSIQVMIRRYRRAAAEAVLSQVAQDSPQAEKARAFLDGLSKGAGK